MSSSSASLVHDAAVIDVGSNSVRLVLYRIEGRSIWTVFNEKVLAGLGRDLNTTGRLSPDGAASAMAALRRFRMVVGRISPDRVFTAATAAIREASDGAAFVEQVASETGLSLRVLSGLEEARYAALGVLAGAPAETGLVGDLGGASLELTPIGPDGAGDGASLPLGPFAFRATGDSDLDGLRREIDERLAGIDRFRTRHFHAVGGAWRNLALIHMHMTGYPLRVVHQYEMSRSDALNACRFVASQSKKSLEAVEGVSRKRAETLPHSALVLERLILRLDIQTVYLSAYGVREGLLFEAMDQGTRRLDPLIEGCSALAARNGADAGLGPALSEWLKAVFQTLEPIFGARDAILRAAACRLADLGARLHPDHRAHLVFEQVLRAPIAGQSHAERAFLAVAAFSRHSSSSSMPEQAAISRLLPETARRRARALGAAIRLGCDLTGRDPALFSRTQLCLDGDRLLLTAEPGLTDLLLGEQTTRRLSALAGHLGARPELSSS
ncbi:MAG: Ppx/GppA family phosphatase [Caulobacteraceae bacterium]|nr:Ppx/GppA family phosphatase [Caulobacteraceae bacterium]